MIEEWVEIRTFPGYSVSNMGQVRNDDKGHLMTLLVNQRGIVNVGLTHQRVQYKKSVALLVAEAFVPRPSFKFDAPINLDGDRFNNRADNLLWRPRWFAAKYMQQFKFNSRGSIPRPVEIVETGEIFDDSFHAAKSLGLLDREIAFCIMTNTPIWPLNVKFRVAK